MPHESTDIHSKEFELNGLVGSQPANLDNMVITKINVGRKFMF